MVTSPKLESNLIVLEVSSVTSRPVIASGGISSLADIEALIKLNNIGVEGAIVGKALYAQAFSFEQALELTRR